MKTGRVYAHSTPLVHEYYLFSLTSSCCYSPFLWFTHDFQLFLLTDLRFTHEFLGLLTKFAFYSRDPTAYSQNEILAYNSKVTHYHFLFHISTYYCKPIPICYCFVLFTNTTSFRLHGMTWKLLIKFCLNELSGFYK